jgi:hypothetical protein
VLLEQLGEVCVGKPAVPRDQRALVDAEEADLDGVDCPRTPDAA